MRRPLQVLGAAFLLALLTYTIAHVIGDASLGGRKGGSEVMLVGGVVAFVTWLVGVGMFAPAVYRSLRAERPGAAAAAATGSVVLGVIVAAIWAFTVFALAILLSEGCCA